MLKRLLVAGLMAGLSHPALAQSAAPTPAQAGGPTMQGNFITQAPGAMRVSNLKGTDVIGSDIKSIGEVEDVLIGADGRAQGVLVGVGGFLGLGQKTVAVPFEAMLWNFDVSPTDGPASSNTGAGLQMQMAPANDPASPGVNTVRPADQAGRTAGNPAAGTVNNAGGITAGNVDAASTGSVAGPNPGSVTPPAGSNMGLGATSPGVGGASAAGGPGALTPMAQGQGSETASRTGMEAAMGGAAPAGTATVQVTGDRKPQRAVLRGASRDELRNAPEFDAKR
ncbi:MAG TPA: PRC-barrel domain-containing protein [Microvirga sp.]|jgi:hypothetical protein|nr:PRC-barrel domain-containing protein [Microvirga sp.]